jgi:hypothetical protein
MQLNPRRRHREAAAVLSGHSVSSARVSFCRCLGRRGRVPPSSTRAIIASKLGGTALLTVKKAAVANRAPPLRVGASAILFSESTRSPLFHSTASRSRVSSVTYARFTNTHTAAGSVRQLSESLPVPMHHSLSQPELFYSPPQLSPSRALEMP